MKRSRDPLTLSPQWHVDCRIEAELPEDNIVGTRFLINFVFSAVALAALIFAGWLGYVNLSWRRQISDWEKRIRDNREEVAEINRMQREYAVESAKIDQAYALIRPQLYISEFVSQIGRIRPDQMVMDVIEWNDAGIVIRGSLVERSSERATQLIGGYVQLLRRDQKIAPLFRDIQLPDVVRGATGDSWRFEIAFRLKNAGS
jgi:hypothetical protein